MTESALLALPVEVLEKIFEPLFSVPDSEIYLGHDNEPTAAVGYRPPLSILSTCKQAGAVGTRILQSSIADCRLSLFMNEPTAFTPHCVSSLRQYGQLFPSVHIIERDFCFGIELLFEHLVGIEDITFSFGQSWICGDSLPFDSEWLSLEDSELQKQLRRPRMAVSQGVTWYVNQLRSACPRIDELKVRVTLCIIFQECADHRLVRNRPFCHRQTLTQDRISHSLGQEGSLCRNSGLNVTSRSAITGREAVAIVCWSVI